MNGAFLFEPFWKKFILIKLNPPFLNKPLSPSGEKVKATRDGDRSYGNVQYLSVHAPDVGVHQRGLVNRFSLGVPPSQASRDMRARWQQLGRQPERS